MEKWKLHIPSEENKITCYKCGLVAGQKVALKKDLVIKNHKGEPTGEVNPKGELWTALSGVKTDPVLWFLQPSGERCTWEDSISELNEWFEIVE